MDQENSPTSTDYEFLRRRELWMRELIRQRTLGEWPRVVGIYLALRMSEKRPYAWPGQKRMAEDLDCDRNTIGRAILKLRREGWILATNEKLGDDAKKDSRSYTYTIRIPIL
ncbi:helix-turn-helix domain-containing protein [Aurantimonas coralicida]|uniref:helix-turn-helix domain-containing protein n=1 Tax=Aurantimonas coralicida TaxID=182270 RepID=UPI001E31C15A|nr:helix-turn-helix domain-containing protein [Aurantimonas coralicida]MCD1645205.1 helix-turn-helix domain-containing protein [Aurantimonas coralicida]